jgi:Nif-specific regulatory protein
VDPLTRSFSGESLGLLAEASAKINSTLDLKTVLDNIAESAAKVMNAQAASVLILDKSRHKLVFVSATGERSHMIQGREFDADLGIAGQVASTGQATVVPDVHVDGAFYEGIDAISRFRTHALMAAPMIVDGEVIGVVEVLNRIEGTFTPTDLELLKVFANLAATGARNAQDHDRLRQQHQLLCDEVLRGDEIIGDSKAIREVRALCERVAPSPTSVLLLGETGTGKELFAKYIHNISPRADKPFVTVHCAAFAETLLESEIFGHEKGAFTGAVSQHVGRFELADGGTIFLDEVGEIPLATQVKLLRVLQEHSFERVGGSTTITCDVRVVTATHRDLKKQIERGAFRDDLFYRLNVFPITVPPLRIRTEDIPRLAEYVTARAAERTSRRPPRIAPVALEMLTRYKWPGNVRELQNIMERAVLMCDGDTIDMGDLPAEITGRATADNQQEEQGTLRGFERAMIVKALEECDWNQSHAARTLGISRDNLRYRIKKYKIERGE